MSNDHQHHDEADRLREAAARIKEQLARRVVGQEQVIDLLLITLFCRGHCLLEGPPGLAKTLLISTLAESLGLSYSRIQFTPDLMPADITGTEIIEEDRATGKRDLQFIAGPIFSNVILADEINRTPPKTQAALLEAMQERQVTVGRVRRLIGEPFLVLATQNPIEQEGTYPLPEAQLDRFMFMVKVDYPTEEEELAIVKQTTADVNASVTPTLSADDLQAMADLVRRVPIADHLAKYAIRLARQTRVGRDSSSEVVDRYLSWGAGPRASQFLVLAGKARAALGGRHCVEMEDLQAVAKPVLRHRIGTNFNAEADGVTPDDVIDRLIESTPAEAAA